MMKKQRIYVLVLAASLLMSNISFAQMDYDYQRDESCTLLNSGQVQTDSFYYYYGKTVLAVGSYHIYCRLLCGGKSSFRYMYKVATEDWIFYHTNGKILAKGSYKVNSELGKDNRGLPETHYFAEKTGTWVYYDINGKTVDKKWVESPLEEAKKNLGNYILNIDLK